MIAVNSMQDVRYKVCILTRYLQFWNMQMQEEEMEK